MDRKCGHVLIGVDVSMVHIDIDIYRERVRDFLNKAISGACFEIYAFNSPMLLWQSNSVLSADVEEHVPRGRYDSRTSLKFYESGFKIWVLYFFSKKCKLIFHWFAVEKRNHFSQYGTVRRNGRKLVIGTFGKNLFSIRQDWLYSRGHILINWRHKSNLEFTTSTKNSSKRSNRHIDYFFTNSLNNSRNSNDRLEWLLANDNEK